MKKINYENGIQNLSPRKFSVDQLSKISDDNYGVLNQSMDVLTCDKNDVFECRPVMFHYHAAGKPVKKHLRTLVSRLNEQEILALQDMTFEQWEQGEEIKTIKFSEMVRSKFRKRELLRKSA